SQNQSVGHAHSGKESGIDDEGQGRESELRPDEVCQHLIQIAEYVLEKLALGTGLNRREQEVAEQSAVFEKEDGKKRKAKKQPSMRGDVRGEEAYALGELGNVILVAHEEGLHESCCVVVPAVFGGELIGKLSGTQL